MGALGAGELAVGKARSREPDSGLSDRNRLAERIYRDGVLPSGELLQGLRSGGTVSGAAAACVLCHRRSGMGTVEGDRIVPPITGRFLYEPRAETLADLDALHTRGPDLAHALGRNRTRQPYTDAALTAAIRKGVAPGGRVLEDLMPRYAIADSDAGLLVDYLRQLSANASPGVGQDAIHFGTVVTPGVNGERSRAMLDVLKAFFEVRSSAARIERQRDKSYAASGRKTYRAWMLHVWELSGPSESWDAQLAAQYARQPVFALISGVSESTWDPVARFCEKKGLPGWFPTVDAPPKEAGHETIYFSRGVLLEAEALARQLLDDGRVTRIVQIRGSDEAAAAAARALREAVGGRAIRVDERVVRRMDPNALQEAEADAGDADAFVFWLRDTDVARLGAVPVPRAPAYFSATLAHGENAPLPPAWKSRARLIYPFELPDKRGARVSRFHAWLKTRNLALVDERLQADAYLACVLMAEKIDEMLESLYRDYLLERAEAILSERLPTVMYHRLSLGPDQRFASKSACIARFVSGEGNAVVAETGWIVP